jgi:hypothetical protein
MPTRHLVAAEPAGEMKNVESTPQRTFVEELAAVSVW